jgi:hypothetical protein
MTHYIKIFTGNFILVQLMKQRLENININPVIKDESESGRLAGFGASMVGQQEIYVHENELDEAVKIIESVRTETEAE